jgi:hypothetical protein
MNIKNGDIVSINTKFFNKLLFYSKCSNDGFINCFSGLYKITLSQSELILYTDIFRDE